MECMLAEGTMQFHSEKASGRRLAFANHVRRMISIISKNLGWAEAG